VNASARDLRVTKSIATLIVDDDALVRLSLGRILGAYDHQVSIATNAEEARVTLSAGHFDLVLCDLNMPGESGIGLVEFILASYPEAAVVMISGQDDPIVAQKALEAGAYGYLIKPLTPNELLINVANALLRKRAELEYRSQREELVEQLRERTEQLWNTSGRLEKSDAMLQDSVEEMVRRLSTATELRDMETAHHIERVSHYCELLSRRAGFNSQQSIQIRMASRLHDAGKIAIPDRILRKRGKFSAEEYETMKQHADIGHQLFDGSDADLLHLAGVIAWTHHEHWDGDGYPRGLAGEAIPIEGRIVCIADVFDALLSERAYKPALPPDRVIDLMRDGREKHFDPELLDLFLEDVDEVFAVAELHPD